MREAYCHERHDEMSIELLEGVSLPELKQKYGAAEMTAWLMFLKTRGQSRRWLPDIRETERLDKASERIATEYRAGVTIKTLAVRYKVRARTLWQWLLAHHVYPNYPPRLEVVKRKRRKSPMPRTPYNHGHRYLAATSRASRSCLIHRACWEAYHGPIPKHRAIHHIDGDGMNNDIDNLVCLTYKQHQLIHHEMIRTASKLKTETARTSTANRSQ